MPTIDYKSPSVTALKTGDDVHRDHGRVDGFQENREQCKLREKLPSLAEVS
jgi:hypothetical protein